MNKQKKDDNLLLWGALALGGYFVWRLLDSRAAAPSASFPAASAVTKNPFSSSPPEQFARRPVPRGDSILGGPQQYITQAGVVNSTTDQAIAIYKSLRAAGSDWLQAEMLVRQAFPAFRKDMAGE